MATVSKNLQKNIMEVMSDREARDIPKLKEDLTRQKNFVYGRDYREGHLAGVLRVLTSNRELEKVERGVYRLNRIGRSAFAGTQAAGNAATGNMSEQHREQDCLEEMSLGQIRQEALTALEAQYRSLVSRMDAIAMSSLAPADFESVKQLSELKEELREILVRHRIHDL